MSVRVLVIDDSPEIHALLAVHLRPEAIELVSAHDWEQGVELATSLLPDLILLDVEMPGTSGLDVCRHLKSLPRTESIPIIFLTASSEVSMKVHGFDLGAVDYVTKPFHPAELRARVRAALRMKRAQDLLTERAQVDALTGLRNRAFFDSRLAIELAEANTGQRPLSLVMVDLDHFKRLNDSFGHPFGDLVLQRVGDTLLRTVRHCDTACRYGGEELALILPNVDREGAMIVAERVLDSIRGLVFVPKGQKVRVTASMGVADRNDTRVGSDGGAHDTLALVTAADQALYRAKMGGRDRVCTFADRRLEPKRPTLQMRKAS